MKKGIKQFSLIGLSAVYLGVCSGCATSGTVDKMSEGIVSKLFERKEETTSVMGGAMSKAFFDASERKYKFRLESSLSKDGEYYLSKGDYYLAAKAFGYSRNLLGMEAAAQIARDKGHLKDFMQISQGLIDNENFEYNAERGYNHAVEAGYEFRKPADLFFSKEKKAVGGGELEEKLK